MSDIILGIDLGTTNSEVAAFIDGGVHILGPQKMLPSCVGLSPQGELLIGQSARNQQLLYPERTVRSIKRKMGSAETVQMGDQPYTAQEISALILRELVRWATDALGEPVSKAIITVPAYFSDAQRQATREAGELAGLEVVRLINEPTAASLAYGCGEDREQTVMVYDLGGGTFDVSIVRIAGDVTEVLASHGDTRLGGDDFDQLLAEHLVKVFLDQHQIDLRGEEHRGSLVRLAAAAEEAKKRLSSEPFAMVREENLAVVDGRARHLEVEISRAEYEKMIRPLIESTLHSVSVALQDAGRKPDEIDVVLLVGGSTRTPLVSEVLSERMGKAPRQDVHPDLCVALGAGLLGARSSGKDVQRVLVDVSPYTFGVSYLDERGGLLYPYCFRPIIHRNTPLPVTRTEVFCTAREHQTEVDVEIFQGEASDAMLNIPVGDFRITGLTPMDDPNEILCRMKLDLSGMLEVTAIEKRTSRSKQVTIAGALEKMSEEEISAARSRLAELFKGRWADDGEWEDESGDEYEDLVAEQSWEQDQREHLALSSKLEGGGIQLAEAADPRLEKMIEEGRALLVRSRGMLEQLHEDDRSEAVDLNEEVDLSIRQGEAAALEAANDALREFLFFVEGR